MDVVLHARIFFGRLADFVGRTIAIGYCQTKSAFVI